MEIDYWFYGNENYTSYDEEMIENMRSRRKRNQNYRGKGGHDIERCQACKENVCRKRIVAKYPESPESLAKAPKTNISNDNSKKSRKTIRNSKKAEQAEQNLPTA